MLINGLRIIAYFCNMRSLLYLLLGIPVYSYSQINNLVANPSFEEYAICPDNTAQIERAIYWFQPLPQSSTEYFNACCSIPDFTGIVGVPLNNFGYQAAKTGIAYGGFAAYGHGIHKEYLEGSLLQSLEANKNYCVEFSYSIPGYFSQYFFISTLGVFFSSDSILSNSNLSIQVTPHVSDLAINDTTDWVKISGSFTAGGGGNFF